MSITPHVSPEYRAKVEFAVSAAGEPAAETEVRNG